MATKQKTDQTKTPRLRKEEAFLRTMQNVQSEMPVLSRSFSRLIHNPFVEAASDIVARTVARPVPLLTGGIVAFFGLIALYLFAKRIGYALTGSEFYLLFGAGWLTGIVIDGLRKLLLSSDITDQQD